MELVRKWKTGGSGDGGCPALYDAEGGGYVIQGLRLDSATRAKLLQLAENEDAVWVPADVIDRILVTEG